MQPHTHNADRWIAAQSLNNQGRSLFDLKYVAVDRMKCEAENQ